MKKIKLIAIVVAVLMTVWALTACVKVDLSEFFDVSTPTPTAQPTSEPTAQPTQQPTVAPTPEPTREPTVSRDGYITNEYFTYIPPEDIDLESMEYETYDVAIIEQTLGELTELGETASDFLQIEEKYAELNTEVYDLLTIAAVATLDYSLDTTDPVLVANDLEATELRIEVSALNETAFLEVLNGKYGEQFRVLLGEEYADNLVENGAKTQEHIALLEQESELVRKYDEESLEEYTYEYSGNNWTMDDILYGTNDLSYEERLEIYDGIVTAKNEVLAAVFSDLVEVRKQIAGFEGYDNYADYAYEKVFNRDYTPEQAKLLHAGVEEYIAPLFEEAYMSAPFAGDFSITEDELFMLLDEYVTGVSPLFEEPLSYLERNDLFLYTDDDAVAMQGAYCTELYSYDAPAIYMLASGDYYDAWTFVHEFGHFTESYYNTIDPLNEPPLILDIAEVHSTALEVLMYETAYEEVFDDNGIMYSLILRWLGTLIDAAVFDEFLQEAYTSDHKLTVEEINEMYLRIESKYRGPMTGWGMSWVEVHHNFSSPFYYLSYGVANLHSLDFMRMTEEDGIEFATDKYFDLMAESMKDLEYSEIMNNVDMDTFTDDGYVESIAAVVGAELSRLAFGDEQLPYDGDIDEETFGDFDFDDFDWEAFWALF